MYCQSDCLKYSDAYIPSSLNDALNYLDCKWSDESKDSFKNKPERGAVTDLHFSVGSSIRSYWGLFDVNSKLFKYFDTLGIFNSEDMSSIILTSFHRRLNNQDIKLEGQIEKYKQHYKVVLESINEQNTITDSLISSAKVGDTIIIEFVVGYDILEPKLEYVYHSYFPRMAGIECRVKGIVKKINKDVEDSTYFTIKIFDLCSDYFNDYYKEIRLGKNQVISEGRKIIYNASLYNFKLLK